MNTPRVTSSHSRRTRLITATSIIAVALAGAFAVSANLGILNRTQKNPVGTLATADLTPTVPQSVNVILDQTASASAAVAKGSQEFVVDVAGTVTVSTVDGSLVLVKATPTAGWSWTLSQTDPSTLKVTFNNGARTLEFTGTRKADGSVDAAVTEPITQPAPPAPQGSGSGEHEHEYEGGGDDD